MAYSMLGFLLACWASAASFSQPRSDALQQGASDDDTASAAATGGALPTVFALAADATPIERLAASELSRLLLLAPLRQRGGRARKQERTRAHLVAERIELLRGGHGLDLAHKAEALSTQRPPLPQRDEAAEKAVLIEEILRVCSLDELRRAVQMLGSAGMAAVGPLGS